MLIQFQDFLTNENIYLWTNISVVPLWVLLIFIPSSRFTGFFLNSIILPLILLTIYIYVIYKAILLNEFMFDFFILYASLDNLYSLFSTDSFLLIFWLHFTTLNLFVGSWISRDGVKYNIPRRAVSVPLILIYFFGPIGLVFYWLVRVFYAKKIALHD